MQSPKDKIKSLVADLKFAIEEKHGSMAYGTQRQIDKAQEKLDEYLNELFTVNNLEDKADIVSLALQQAFRLGQDWWRQADSESYKQNKLADVTQQKFDELVTTTRERVLQC